MSFSSETKAEMCREKNEHRCCSVAESYGVLLYCNTFSPSEIRIITASTDFAQRLPKLFKRAFGLSFDRMPPENAEGKVTFLINDPAKIALIYETFGLDAASTLTHHVNFAVIENECCRRAFVRGAFLAGGSVTDPEKRFHMELATNHAGVSGETCSVMQELGFSPKEARRNSSTLLYFKQADVISEFFSSMGAPVAGMNILTAKVAKEMNNTITRRVNCDSANADKVVAAAQEQMDAIRFIAREFGLESLPEPLYDAALLRITNPEASLADLATLSNPPVTKSCLSHRLKKILALAQEYNKE